MLHFSSMSGVNYFCLIDAEINYEKNNANAEG